MELVRARGDRGEDGEWDLSREQGGVRGRHGGGEECANGEEGGVESSSELTSASMLSMSALHGDLVMRPDLERMGVPGVCTGVR